MAELVALLTDFGYRDVYVGVMKAVMLSVAPRLRFIDLSHDLPPYDVQAGMLALDAAWPYVPAGTVFLCVVDPGVGTPRRPIVVQSAGRLFVGPDNGLFSLLPDAEAREITAPWGLPHRSRTFHGRDLFAPVAAHLAAGAPFLAVGPRVDPVRRPLPLPDGDRGEIIYIDHYGNCVTNLPGRTGGEVVSGAHTAPVCEAYGDAGCGALLALTGSTGRLELAVRNGSAAELGLRVGSPVEWRATEARTGADDRRGPG